MKCCVCQWDKRPRSVSGTMDRVLVHVAIERKSLVQFVKTALQGMELIVQAMLV